MPEIQDISQNVIESDATYDAENLLLRRAARALDRHKLVHAYGHCSQRIDDNYFLVCPSKPMGLIESKEMGTIVPINGPLPENVLGEVRIHREIYKRRPDIGGVVRSMPPQTMALSVLGKTPRIIHGMSSYFSPSIPLWNDPQLIRDDAAASAIAEKMNTAAAIVMRGNGAVVASTSIQDAVVLTWYLEDAARIEINCLAKSDQAILLTPEEAQQRATRSGLIFERMWDYLTYGDKE